MLDNGDMVRMLAHGADNRHGKLGGFREDLTWLTWRTFWAKWT